MFVDVAGSDHQAADLRGDGLLLLDLLPETSLAGSKREAREFLSNGSISINGTKVDKASALEHRIGPDDLLHGRMILIRRGKKTWHATRWS
ncbi:MAG TPA: hypothetical protein DEO57_00720 [Phycisphaerales bacterium]|nr:hypothetical protein [Phycisphaerales bacterium]